MQGHDDDTPASRALPNAAAHWPALSQRIAGVSEPWTRACTIASIKHRAVASGTAGLWRITAPRRGANAPPVTVIVKRLAPAVDDSGRWPATSDPSDPYYWGREAAAYEHALFGDARAGIRTAHCYLADRQADAIDLYLEDVAGQPGTRWHLDTYARAAERLGRFQAAALHRANDAVWLRGPAFFEQYLARRAELYENAEEIVRAPVPYADVESLRAFVTPLQQLWERRDRVLTFLDPLPPTRCHNDFWSPNLFDVPAGSITETVAIDLAYAGLGALGHDAANLAVDAVIDFFVPAGDAPRLWALVAAGYRRGLATELSADVVEAAERVMEMTAALKFGWLIPATFRAAGNETTIARIAQQHGDPATFFRKRAAALRFAGGFIERSLAALGALG